MFEAMGPGKISHPDEIQKFRDEIYECGASLIESEEERLAYGPATREGSPGTVYVSKGASDSAWCHEMEHLRYDKKAGWRGMRGLILDPDWRYESEKRAYAIEINMAKEINRGDIAKRLSQNLEEERRAIYGWNNRTYSEDGGR